MSENGVKSGEREQERRGSGARLVDKDDADRFVVAADNYTAANTRSRAVAFQNLVDLGLIDSSGNPTKNYR